MIQFKSAWMASLSIISPKDVIRKKTKWQSIGGLGLDQACGYHKTRLRQAEHISKLTQYKAPIIWEQSKILLCKFLPGQKFYTQK